MRARKKGIVRTIYGLQGATPKELEKHPHPVKKKPLSEKSGDV